MVPTTWWGRVREGSRELREQRGAKGVKGSETGSKGSKKEQTQSKGSKIISILGFRVPTTCGRKYLDDHI